MSNGTPLDTANVAYSTLVRQLCDCTAIDSTRRGQPCYSCGKRIISKEDERWLWSQLDVTYGFGYRTQRP